jgi:NitT/TauT family transport system ATP-binding protein
MLPRPAAKPIEFRDVSRRFDDGTHALDSVSLTVEAGSFVALIGPSGCGKTTLLRLASGLDTPTGGTISIDRGQLGYTFQDATLLPWRTIQKNIEVMLELKGVAKAERQQRAAAQIEAVALTGFEHHYPKQLSGGMKMRASLARALTLDPTVFLFDEPFGSLDAITREKLNDDLHALYVAQRFTSLFVTHSIAEAVFLSSRVIVMSDRPGRNLGVFAVPFDIPRSPDLRYDASFAALCGEVHECLRAGGQAKAAE